MSDDDLLGMLRGGDLRSIGRADEVVERVLERPDLFDRLIEGLAHGDPVVRARAADAAEKASARRPELLEPYAPRLLGDLAQIPQQEVRWHVAPMLTRLPLSDRDVTRATEILGGYLDDDSRIVRVMTMQALADLAVAHPELRARVRATLEQLTQDGSAAMRARGRKLLAQLDRAESSDEARGD